MTDEINCPVCGGPTTRALVAAHTLACPVALDRAALRALLTPALDEALAKLTGITREELLPRVVEALADEIARRAAQAVADELRAADTRLYPLSEAARRLGVSRATLGQLVAAGRIQVIRLPGGEQRIAGAELARFAREGG